MNRAAALSLSLLLSVSSTYAATTYRLVTTGPAGTTASRVWVDGQRYRMELEPSAARRTHDIVISTDGDRTATMLNLGQQTWFRREEVQSGFSSRLVHLPGMTNENLSKLTFETHDEVSDLVFDGRRTEKRVMRVTYMLTADVGGAPLRGFISITGMLVNAPELPQAPYRVSFRSGFAEVDDAIQKFLSALPGLLVDQTMAITQVIEGVRPRAETTRTVIENYESAEPPVAAFEVPAGLQHVPPASGRP